MDSADTRPARPRWKKQMIFVGKIVLSLVALYVVYRKVDLDNIRSLLHQGSWIWLFPAILAFVASQVLSAFRLNALFGSVGLELRESANLRLYWLGMYYNLLLPGGIGGDAYKVVQLRRHQQVQTRDLILTTLADRGFGLIALTSIGLSLFGFLDVDNPWAPWAPALVPVIMVMAWLVVGWVQRKWLSVFWAVLGWSLLVQLCQLASILALLALLGQPSPWIGYLVLFLGSSILAALPLSYGGAGAREVAFLYGAEWLQLPSAPAVALSILFYLITLVVSLSGMYFSFGTWEKEQLSVNK